MAQPAAVTGKPGPLAHTFSIVARDPATGEMGVAVQSHWFSVGSIVTWAEAGVGAVATQSFVDPAYGYKGLALMRSGVSAPGGAEAAARRRRPARSPAGGDDRRAGPRRRVHAARSTSRPPATRSGAQYSVQANMMANAKVWPAMAAAFEKTRGDLADAHARRARGRSGGGRRHPRQAVGRHPDRQGEVVGAAVGRRRSRVRSARRGSSRADPRTEAPHPAAARLRARQPRRRTGVGEEDRRGAEGVRRGRRRSRPRFSSCRSGRRSRWRSVGREAEAEPIFRRVFAKEPYWADLVPRLPAAGQLPDDPALIARIVALEEK